MCPIALQCTLISFISLLSLACSNQVQMLLAEISQITKVSLKFSDVGVGFFVMYFSMVIARQIQIHV